MGHRARHPYSKSVRTLTVTLYGLLQGRPTAGFIISDTGRVIYLDIGQRAAQLSRDHDFAGARALLRQQLASSPRNGAMWSQVRLSNWRR